MNKTLSTGQNVLLFVTDDKTGENEVMDVRKRGDLYGGS